MVDPPYTVYLLCFERPVDGHHHYVGITTPTRLYQRMIEHHNGRGANLTKSAFIEGAGFRLTALFPAYDPCLETLLQKDPLLSQRCPFCMYGLQLRHYPNKNDPTRSVAEWGPLSF